MLFRSENLEEAILTEVPPLYPLTVLTKQTISDLRQGWVTDITIVDYFYDEVGYLLRKESQYYQWNGGQKILSGTATTTYSHDGEGHCVVTHSDGNTFQTDSVPGTINETLGSTSCFADPLVSGHRDDRSKIGPDGRFEINDRIHLMSFDRSEERRVGKEG